METNKKKETDFVGVSEWLEENVLPMLEEKCEGPLEAIYALTTFTKNAALTMSVLAGYPPKKTMDACKAIFDKKNYNDKGLTALAAIMAEKNKENGGIIDMIDAIGAIDELMTGH